MQGEKFKNGLDLDFTDVLETAKTLSQLSGNPFTIPTFENLVKTQIAVSLAGIVMELDSIRKELHEMNTNQHFVDFTMCTKCKHKDVDLNEEPCFTCLGVAAREDGSRKPVKFEEKKEQK